VELRGIYTHGIPESSKLRTTVDHIEKLFRQYNASETDACSRLLSIEFKNEGVRAERILKQNPTREIIFSSTRVRIHKYASVWATYSIDKNPDFFRVAFVPPEVFLADAELMRTSSFLSVWYSIDGNFQKAQTFSDRILNNPTISLLLDPEEIAEEPLLRDSKAQTYARIAATDNSEIFDLWIDYLHLNGKPKPSSDDYPRCNITLGIFQR